MSTGYIGAFVAKEFKSRGYWVRAIARNDHKLQILSDWIDEKFIGLVTSLTTLRDGESLVAFTLQRAARETAPSFGLEIPGELYNILTRSYIGNYTHGGCNAAASPDSVYDTRFL